MEGRGRARSAGKIDDLQTLLLLHISFAWKEKTRKKDYEGIYIYIHAYCMDGLHRAPVYASTSGIFKLCRSSSSESIWETADSNSTMMVRKDPLQSIGVLAYPIRIGTEMLKQSTRKGYVLHLRPG